MTRVLLAKPGLDGHDKGIKVLATMLRDIGCEVIYTGLHQTPQKIALAAVQEDVDVVGLSMLSGAHVELTRDVVNLLREVGLDDRPVLVGGNIPDADVKVLEDMGVAAVFPTGTPYDEILGWFTSLPTRSGVTVLTDTGREALVEDLRRTKELALALSAIERGGSGLLPENRVPGSVVGLVGPPGVGKSTVISALVGLARSRGERVVVLAVDPSSPVTGGALLGDRIRMASHATDPGTFVRSFASRGHPGGLAAAVPAAAETALALGWDRVFIEPVGGGQNDIDVAACADRVVLVVSPESGDDVQALKAGILEIADVLAINKADRPGAAAFRNMLRSQWRRPESGGIVMLSATDNTGVEELDALIRVIGSGDKQRREAAQLSAVLHDVVDEVRLALKDPELAAELLELLRSGRRRDAVRRLIGAARP